MSEFFCPLPSLVMFICMYMYTIWWFLMDYCFKQRQLWSEGLADWHAPRLLMYAPEVSNNFSNPLISFVIWWNKRDSIHTMCHTIEIRRRGKKYDIKSCIKKSWQEFVRLLAHINDTRSTVCDARPFVTFIVTPRVARHTIPRYFLLENDNLLFDCVSNTFLLKITLTTGRSTNCTTII